MTYLTSAPLASIVPREAMTGLNAKTAAFAQQHGSFALCFDATQNGASPDYRPWTLILDSDDDHGWGGFTAEEAIDFAAADLGREQAAGRESPDP